MATVKLNVGDTVRLLAESRDVPPWAWNASGTVVDLTDELVMVRMNDLAVANRFGSPDDCIWSFPDCLELVGE